MQDIALALEITLNTGSQYIKIYEKKILEQKIIILRKNFSKISITLQKMKRNF